MASELRVDTQRLRMAAGQLDDAVADFRRVDAEPPVAEFTATAFGGGGAAVEVASQIIRRLRQGAECCELLSRRGRQLADSLRSTATRFDELEAALAGGPR